MGFNGKGWQLVACSKGLRSFARWRYIEDAITATEKALDDALWDGLDTTYLERELAGLRAAQAAGEKYDTDW